MKSAVRKKFCVLVMAVLLAALYPARDALAGLEAVYVQKVFDLDNKAIIVRRNGEVYLIEYGVGVLSLPFYEGKTVYIYSPGIFAGVGSKIIIPDRDQEAQIWNAELIDTSPFTVPSLPPTLPVPVPTLPSTSQPRPTVPKSAPVLKTGGSKAQVRVYVNGVKVNSDAAALVLNGRTMVPLRGVVEALGGSVLWDESAQIIVAGRRGKTPDVDAVAVALMVGDTEGLKRVWFRDGREVETRIVLDVPPVIVSGRTLVPLRFVVEALGASVTWDEKSRSVYITG